MRRTLNVLKVAAVTGFFSPSALRMSSSISSEAIHVTLVSPSQFGDRAKSIASKFGVFTKVCEPDSSISDKIIIIEKDGLQVDELQFNSEDVNIDEELQKRLTALLSVSSPVSSSDVNGPLKTLWNLPVSKFKDEMAVAVYAVQLASTVARELQKALATRTAMKKNDKSPVTVADFTVQAIVLGVLHRYFPNDGFIAEESSGVLKDDPSTLESVIACVRKVISTECTFEEICGWIDLGARGGKLGINDRTWVLDPIDGTKGFIRGEQFCCALGMLEGGKGVLGVLGCPVLPADLSKPLNSQIGQILFAAKGGGAFRRFMGDFGSEASAVHTDTASYAKEGAVLESAESAHTSHGVAFEVCNDLQISRPPIRMDSQCKYACLAAGEGSIYLRMPRWGYRENIWDHVAGAVVIEEAGGKVTDSMGLPLDFSQGTNLPPHVAGIVATSGPIHDEVLAVVRRRLGQDWVAACSSASDPNWKGAGPGPGHVVPMIASTSLSPARATDIVVVFHCSVASRNPKFISELISFSNDITDKFTVNSFWGEDIEGIAQVQVYLGGRVVLKFEWTDAEKSKAMDELRFILE